MRQPNPLVAAMNMVAAAEVEKQIDDFGAAALQTADERNAAVATLRTIANWLGYKPHQNGFDDAPDDAINEAYEHGANDMLETLASMARETLNDMGLSS